MQAIKDGFAKAKGKLQALGEWIAGKYRGNRKACRGTLISLALLFLLAGLIVGSYKWVDSVSLGAAINYTSGTIVDRSVSNYGSFLGLNTYYQTVPSTHFLISFQNAAATGSHVFPAVRARVVEGTLLEVEVQAKVRIVAGSMKAFFEEYGFEAVGGQPAWLVYIKEKVRNAVIQQMAGFRFYQLSNAGLCAAINAQFAAYETASALSFPFAVRAIGISLRYPPQTLQAKGTLGVRLLEQQSLLSQLSSQLAEVRAHIEQYRSATEAYAVRRAEIEARMGSREQAVRAGSGLWTQGVQAFSDSVRQNSTLVQKYLETYFNALYNVTYRIESLQPFRI